MKHDNFSKSIYASAKDFSQNDIPMANPTGLSGAVADDTERSIDLNEQLILNKPATFIFRMNGDAMENAGIQSGDILIVDRSIKAVSGKIIIAAVNGDLVVRRFQQTINQITLVAENPRYSSIGLGEFTEFRPWGVVTCVIHILERSLMPDSRKPVTQKTHANNKVRY